ncbi:hypothetical protein [Duganella sp. Root1480D1]|uniref:hypothetical protein n=1 Tax=Duganella sp. Root1480D1 TaxID=1736471 RepID=UPI0012E379D2|nr:hypothetical protein [Duganella sp. Root1480D1]
MNISSLKATGRIMISSALCAIAVAHAPIASAANTTEGPFTIKSVIVGGYGAHIEVTPAPAGCTADWSGTQLVVLKESPIYRELLAGVLSAQAQAKPLIVIHTPQGSGICSFGNQKEVVAIQIKS